MIDRYTRQTLFSGIGSAGQHHLAAASVAIAGLGATGSTIANTLARAGVGHLRLIDRDWVEWHNLQRQMLYSEADARDATPKAVALAHHLQAINSTIELRPLVADLNADTIEAAFHGVDLVLDGSDNFELRYLLNDWCVQQRTPWVYTGVIAAYGVTATFVPDGPCYRCAFPHLPAPGSAATCDTVGVVGPVVGVMGNLAAAEALKLLVNTGTRNPGLLHIDLWDWTFDQLPLPPRQPDCPTCGRGEFPFLLADQQRTVSLCGRNAIQVRPHVPTTLDLAGLAKRLERTGLTVRRNDYLLRFSADDYQLTVFADARAIIGGTEDEAIARSVYARWIGM